MQIHKILVVSLAGAKSLTRTRRDLIGWNRRLNTLRTHDQFRYYDKRIIRKLDFLSEFRHHLAYSKSGNLTNYYSTYIYSLVF